MLGYPAAAAAARHANLASAAVHQAEAGTPLQQLYLLLRQTLFCWVLLLLEWVQATLPHYLLYQMHHCELLASAD
jgi:hypothetical protein